MNDYPRTEDNRIASPCVRICCLDDDNICIGCFRSVEEITAWSEASDDERMTTLKQAQHRRLRHQRRYPAP